MPSSELKVSRLFSMKCHFGGNELVYGEEACRNWSEESMTLCHGSYISPCSCGEESTHFSVLKKASDDVETSASN